MPIRVSRFEMPKRLVKEESSATPNYARFIAEPLEVGYGRTIGNCLRRVLLSSVEGAAITSVKIEGAPHEFSTIPGMVEDVTDLVLNLKKVLLKMHSREPRRLTLKKKGPGKVTAGDMETDGTVEILNPDQVLGTLAEDGVLDMELEIRIGRGFCAAEALKGETQEIGRIFLDSIFSPVRRVNFLIENTRVGQRTDYDKLVLEVATDGRITPTDALVTASAILRHHLDVFADFTKDSVEFDQPEKGENSEREELIKLLNTSVNEIELSVRAANCLNNANLTTVGELCQKTEPEMLKYRNFGKKSLNEIKAKLQEMNLQLGMKFDEEVLKRIKRVESLQADEN